MTRANILEDSSSTAVPSIDIKAKYQLNAQTAFNKSLIESTGRCGCFHCGSSFDVSEVHDWIDEPHGEKTALCPYCAVDAVIVGTKNYPLSTALLSKLYMDWFKEEYEKAREEGNSFPDYYGFGDFLKRGIPFQITHDPKIEIVGSIDLFHIGSFDMEWDDFDFDDDDLSGEPSKEEESEARQEDTSEEDEETGSFVSVAAYFDENGYYHSDFIDSKGNKLPYEPWTGTMQDLVLDLTKQYGSRLKGMLKSPYSNTLDLFVVND